MTTQTLDKLYLEWSQFTKAKTARELELESALKLLLDAANPFIDIVLSTNGRIPAERLSLKDWHSLANAYDTACSKLREK